MLNFFSRTPDLGARLRRLIADREHLLIDCQLALKQMASQVEALDAELDYLHERLNQLPRGEVKEIKKTRLHWTEGDGPLDTGNPL